MFWLVLLVLGGLLLFTLAWSLIDYWEKQELAQPGGGTGTDSAD